VADYIRFELLLLAFYHVDEPDGPVYYQIDARLIQRFFNATIACYRGLSDPGSQVGPLFTGYWQEVAGAAIEVDELTYAFCLVKASDAAGAMRFFTGWKRCLEKGLHQEIVLILHAPVQTIGDELSA
jgi:hypothetical protein